MTSVLLVQAPEATFEELQRVHDADYLQRFCEGKLTDKDMRGIGFPWSQQLVTKCTTSSGGTLAATRSLLEWKLPMTCNLAGQVFVWRAASSYHVGQYLSWSDKALYNYRARIPVAVL